MITAKQTVALLAVIKNWEFHNRHLFYMEQGVQPLPPLSNNVLDLLNSGQGKVGPKCRAPILRVLAFYWLGDLPGQCTPPVYHSLN